MDLESNDMILTAQEVSLWEYLQLSTDSLFDLLVENKGPIVILVLIWFLIRAYKGKSAS